MVLISFFILWNSITGCAKKSEQLFAGEADTLEPRAYYPVFPGSSWVYVNQNNDTVKHFTLPAYKAHQIGDNAGQVVFVPFLNRGEATPSPIYQYDEIVSYRPYTPPDEEFHQVPFMSEIIGDKISRGSRDFRMTDVRTTVTVTAKTFINGDSVLILTGTYHTKAGVFNERYTKNVGLTFYSSINPTTGDTIEKLRLIRANINRR
jgi:hypothetical protein